jgi:hypothetical protein
MSTPPRGPYCWPAAAWQSPAWPPPARSWSAPAAWSGISATPASCAPTAWTSPPLLINAATSPRRSRHPSAAPRAPPSPVPCPPAPARAPPPAAPPAAASRRRRWCDVSAGRKPKEVSSEQRKKRPSALGVTYATQTQEKPLHTSGDGDALEEPPADERLRWRRGDALFSLETDEAAPALSPASNDPDLRGESQLMKSTK